MLAKTLLMLPSVPLNAADWVELKSPALISPCIVLIRLPVAEMVVTSIDVVVGSKVTCACALLVVADATTTTANNAAATTKLTREMLIFLVIKVCNN